MLKGNMLGNVLLYGFLAWITWGGVTMAKAEAPLSADEAFSFSATMDQSNIINAKWKIAPGYYLYRDKFNFVLTPSAEITAAYPKTEFKYDEKYGQRAVYAGNLAIPLTVATLAKKLNLTVYYQGCSKSGFCYPPVQKTISLSSDGLMVGSAERQELSFTSLLTNQQAVASLFHQQQTAIVLLVFLGIGLLLSCTPCIFPMVPILTSIIVGYQQPLTTKRAFALSLTYVLGMSVAYALIGLAAAALGESLQIWLQNPWAIGAGGLLFIVLAFAMFGLFELRLPRYWHNYVAYWSYEQRGGSFIGVFLMGLLSTLIVSPCVTAPLVGALLYVAQTGNLWFGAAALFVMGMGMGIPLLIVGMSAGKWLPKSGAWMEMVKKSFGFVMLAMAVWLLSRLFAPVVINIMWSLFIVAVVYFVSAYAAKSFNRKKWVHALVLLIGIVGVGYVNGSHYMRVNHQANSFKIVSNMTQINQDLSKHSAMPVILDFYADWCESCVSMDKHVFSQPVIKQALSGFTLLRVDLSKNTAEDQILLKHFNVIAPPTMLFFDMEGNEVSDRRIVGEMNANEFLSRIDVFYAAGCDKKASC